VGEVSKSRDSVFSDPHTHPRPHPPNFFYTCNSDSHLILFHIIGTAGHIQQTPRNQR
jgi:hypothetical protein